MKPQFLNRAIEIGNSFALQQHPKSDFRKLWHYHPELELMWIQQGTGSLFVGDNVGKFEPGYLVLIGKNLPHLWQHDKEHFEEGNELKVNAKSIHFNEEFLTTLIEIPEFAYLDQLVLRANHGLLCIGKANMPVFNHIKTMFTTDAHGRVVLFLEILRQLYHHPEYNLLSSPGYLESFKEIRDTKILPVYEYVMNNFKGKISLTKAASIANMNPSYFSRYFAGCQKKSFIKFVNEIRIGYACKLLMDGNHNVAEACFESGFNNLSNFNRQFFALKNMSPSAFRKQYSPN